MQLLWEYSATVISAVQKSSVHTKKLLQYGNRKCLFTSGRSELQALSEHSIRIGCANLFL